MAHGVQLGIQWGLLQSFHTTGAALVTSCTPVLSFSGMLASSTPATKTVSTRNTVRLRSMALRNGMVSVELLMAFIELFF